MTNQTGQTLKTLSSAFREIADHVMITSPQGVVEYVNPAFEATTGYASHEIVGLTPSLLRSGQHGKDYYQKLWKTILSGGIFYATTANKKKTVRSITRIKPSRLFLMRMMKLSFLCLSGKMLRSGFWQKKESRKKDINWNRSWALRRDCTAFMI